MNHETLRLQIDAAIATITLSRPEKRNAISPRMVEEFLTALGEIESSNARVVIVTGSGKAFCAGADLESVRALGEQSIQQNLEDSRHIASLFYRIYSFPLPVITAVNGPAIAGGCGIATLADFTIAVPEAKFGYSEVKIGFLPAIVSVFLRRQVGDKVARDLLLSGRAIDAAEATRLGLVTEVVESASLMARAHQVADSLLESSPTSLARTKRLLLAFDESAVRSELELAIQENAGIRSTADFKEGISAFLEKRKPRWGGC